MRDWESFLTPLNVRDNVHIHMCWYCRVCMYDTWKLLLPTRLTRDVTVYDSE